MKRADLEHLLRAAGAITGIRKWVVIGSQAILGGLPDAPEALLVSQEADLYAPDSDVASDLVDGSIGEMSPFHETFGYYAHGVGPETAVLPSRWRERAVLIDTPATDGTVGICPHPADLAVSKLAAWRPKDKQFLKALIRHRIVTLDEIRLRLQELDDVTAALIEPRLRMLASGQSVE